MGEFIYDELKDPFSYASKGSTVEAKFITLTAPTFKQLDKVAPIKQAFMSAIAEVTEGADTEAAEADDTTDEGIDGAQVLQVMYRASEKMTTVLLHAEQLFKSGAAMVDGEEKLTSELMGKMSFDDFEGLVGAYIANFIAPSLMDGR